MQQYTELSIEERAVIQVSLSMGISQRGIAKKLKRSPSTISREIKRNSVNSEYTAQTAQQIRCRKRQVCRPSKKLVPGEELFEIVIEMLQDKFSPEQIAGHLRNMNTTNDKDRYVCRETIYNAIYALPVGELRKELIICLRQGKSTRKPRTGGVDRPNQIPDMVSIHDRPPEVEERLVPGHWEGDLIKGAFNRSAIGTLVERTTLFTVLSRMEGAGAESALSGFSHVLNRIESQKRLSLTYDQGKEMTEHQRLTQATGVKVYFADPHSPWQRGINENTNGLLRQYFPKGTDLGDFTQEELDAVAWQLNTRPRKSLGFKCPAELFSADAFDFRHHHASLFALGH